MSRPKHIRKDKPHLKNTFCLKCLKWFMGPDPTKIHVKATTRATPMRSSELGSQ